MVPDLPACTSRLVGKTWMAAPLSARSLVVTGWSPHASPAPPALRFLLHATYIGEDRARRLVAARPLPEPTDVAVVCPGCASPRAFGLMGSSTAR